KALILKNDFSGLTGNIMDCHRLITYAAHQGYYATYSCRRVVRRLFLKGQIYG
ncbi:hypothetical protein FRX31_015943, partial [Thalictrum thalictroides]